MAVLRLALVSLVVALNVWLAQGEFLPLQFRGKPIDYLIVSASLGRLIADWAVVAVLLLSWHVVSTGRTGSGRLRLVLTKENTRYLLPLFWFVLGLLPLLNLLPQLAGRLSPWSYFLFDLRWWWWPLPVFAAVRSGWPERWQPLAWRTWLGGRAATVAVAAAAAGAMWLSAPSLRSKTFLAGDEPKYIRYCEAFYQGLGFDIAHLSTLSDLPKDFRPRILDNVRELVAAVPEEAANLVHDAGAFVGGQRTFNRAKYTGRWFISGKRPGSVYQVHQPGLGLLLFPAYFLDRSWLADGWSFDGRFPVRMPAVGFALLALFALYAAAIRAFLLEHGADAVLAIVLALLGVLSLPISGLAFQAYPEIAAGICFVLVARHLLSERSVAVWKSALYGAVSAYPVWLHVRFGLAIGVLAAWAISGWRRDRRATAVFLAAAAGVFLAFCLYSYRLTGSLLPTAVYDTRGGVFSLADVVGNMPAALFDRTWGLLSHAPVYVLAPLGLWTAWQRQRRAAILSCLLVAAVSSSAGHDFAAGGTVPGRYFASAMPFLLLLLAQAAMAFRRHAAFSAALVVLGLATLETAFAYNHHDFTEVSTLVVSGFAGWRPNNLFPEMHRAGLAALPLNVALLYGWVIVAVGLAVVGRLSARRPAPGGARRGDESNLRRPSVRPGWVAALAAALALVGTIIAAARGEWVRADYVTTPTDAGRQALTFHLARGGRCALCATSRAGEVDPVALLGASANTLEVTSAGDVRAGQATDLRVVARAGEDVPAWGALRVEFGDGAFEKSSSLYGEARVRHVYSAPGTYVVRAWVTTRPAGVVTAETTVTVQ